MGTRIRVDLPKGASIRTLLAKLTGLYEGLNDLLFADPETPRSECIINPPDDLVPDLPEPGPDFLLRPFER